MNTLRWCLWLNAAALAAVAVGFRVWSLENVPGLNGDEAWYGVQAMELLDGGAPAWQTPTGNPLNPLFIGPVALLHAVWGPSVGTLRAVAVASGLLALAVNWLLARRVFDRATAAASTLALAALPVNIVYSRFAWDASQSLLATLPVLYLSLGAVRFGERRRRWLAGAVAALVVAVVVHPANVFAAAGPIAAAGAVWGSREAMRTLVERLARPRTLLVTGLLLAAAAAGVACYFRATNGLLAERLTGIADLTQRRGLAHFLVLYPRLLAGGTVYEYLAGTASWTQWPAAGGWGVDTFALWAGLLLAAAVLWRGADRGGNDSDTALAQAWAIGVLGFLLAAGPSGMAPGYERYALCLVAPSVLLLVRGAMRWTDTDAAETPPRSRRPIAAGLAASLLGWLLLADFYEHYFAEFAARGGQSHATFRTAAVEPKLAALRAIADRSGPGDVHIVTSEYWLSWPLRYFAFGQRNVRVTLAGAGVAAEFSGDEMPGGQTWRVEFTGSPACQRVRDALPAGTNEETIADAAGRPLLSLFALPPVP